MPAVYDQGLDNEVSVLADICDRLADLDIVELRVSGFGQDRWPVDVRTDLLTVLEQLPGVIRAIKNDAAAFTLEFPEQGIERSVHFTRHGNVLSATCFSGTDWQPEPPEVVVGVDELQRMLSKLAADFERLAMVCCALHVQHQWFRHWARDIQQV